MRGNYFWGAPITKKARQRAWEVLAAGREPPALAALLTSYLNRVTDKTAAVLTLAGLVFAISLFVMEKKFDPFVGVSGFLSTLGIFFLAMNLGTVWRKDQANWNPDLPYLRDLFFLFARRAVRLQLGLWLIGLAALFSFIALANAEIGADGRAAIATFISDWFD